MRTEFFKPTDMKSALDLLEKYKDTAVIVNGGSDIAGKIAEGVVKPAAVIYIADIKELQYITERDGKIAIGGAVTYAAMLSSPIIQKVPGLIEAVKHLASPPIRRIATAAGNLGTCAPSADCATMLVGLGAKVVLASAGGERTLAVEEFLVQSYKTALAPNELIKEIYFDAPKAGDGSGYIRLARRKSQDIGNVLISASLTVKDGVCTKAAIGLGALGPASMRATSVEEAIAGKKKEDALEYVRKNFPKEAKLRDDRFKQYKELVTCVAVERAVAMAWNNAQGV